jgi:hypothetical protein
VLTFSSKLSAILLSLKLFLDTSSSIGSKSTLGGWQQQEPHWFMTFRVRISTSKFPQLCATLVSTMKSVVMQHEDEIGLYVCPSRSWWWWLSMKPHCLCLGLLHKKECTMSERTLFRLATSMPIKLINFLALPVFF